MMLMLNAKGFLVSIKKALCERGYDLKGFNSTLTYSSKGEKAFWPKGFGALASDLSGKLQ